MHAVVLSVGDELVLGQTVDTNGAWLSARLAEIGLPTLYRLTVGDDRDAITRALREAAGRAGLILLSGGLGPTEDDLTREALADALSAPLVLDDDSLSRIEARFAQRGRAMPQRNRVQAMHPAGTTIIPNDHGTAPGIAATLESARIYLMPGVPAEMKAMFNERIAWQLTRTPDPSEPGHSSGQGGHGVILTTRINSFGLGESDAAARLGDLMHRDRNPRVGTTVADGIVAVRIRSEAADEPTARRALEETAAIVHARLAPFTFGRDDQTLAQAVVGLLKQQGLILTIAESCTSGMLGAMIGEVPGASSVFKGGWVCYANAFKSAELGVPADLLEREGAVSQPVAEILARRALERAGADLAVSITGIAGPDGGTADKPVGLVWIGLARRVGPTAAGGAEFHGLQPRGDGGGASQDGTGVVAETYEFHFGASRQVNRDRAARSALQLIRLTLQGEDADALTWGRRANATSAAP